MAQRVIFYGNPSLCRPQPHEVMVGVHDDLSKPLDDFVDGVIGTIYLPVRRMLGMRVRMKTDNFEVMVMADVRERDREQALSRVVGPGYLHDRAIEEARTQAYRSMTRGADEDFNPNPTISVRTYDAVQGAAISRTAQEVMQEMRQLAADMESRVRISPNNWFVDPPMSEPVASTRTAQETLQEIERAVRIHGLRPLSPQFRDAATNPDEGEEA